MTGTDDALAAMVAATQARKSEASAKLTPVEGEMYLRKEELVTVIPPAPALTGADFSELLLAIDDSRSASIRYHDRLRSAVSGLLAKLNATPPPELDEGAVLDEAGVDIVAAAQRVFPDATFVEGFDAKSKAAQAAVFGPKAWECPTHGTASLTTRSTRKGKYSACTACGEFER